MSYSLIAMTKKLIIPFLFLMATACGKVVNDQGFGDTGNFNQTVLQQANTTHCSTGHQLVVDQNALNVTFQHLGDSSKVFAFSQPNYPSCIVTQDIHNSWDNYGIRSWFDLSLHWSCLQNNSLWEVVSSGSTGSGYTYSLKSLDDKTLPQIDMSASLDVNGGYINQHAGLHVLTCQ